MSFDRVFHTGPAHHQGIDFYLTFFNTASIIRTTRTARQSSKSCRYSHNSYRFSQQPTKVQLLFDIPHLRFTSRTGAATFTLMVTLPWFILNLISISHLLTDGLQHVAN